MEEILVHLDQIKENILKQKEEIEEQSKYLTYFIYIILFI